MNREQLDTIVKQALHATTSVKLEHIGAEANSVMYDVKWIKALIVERERALKLLSDDAARGKIVDAILKEMTP